jgi:hypothetical protein
MKALLFAPSDEIDMRVEENTEDVSQLLRKALGEKIPGNHRRMNDEAVIILPRPLLMSISWAYLGENLREQGFDDSCRFDRRGQRKKPFSTPQARD